MGPVQPVEWGQCSRCVLCVQKQSCHSPPSAGSMQSTCMRIEECRWVLWRRPGAAQTLRPGPHLTVFTPASCHPTSDQSMNCVFLTTATCRPQIVRIDPFCCQADVVNSDLVFLLSPHNMQRHIVFWVFCFVCIYVCLLVTLPKKSTKFGSRYLRLSERNEM